jgi:hypothetical protein
MENNLQSLLDLGFESVGEWKLRFDQLSFQIDRYKEKKNILYAFVGDGKILYIGKSDQTLYQRMNGYKNPGPTQSTNINNHSRMKGNLEQNKRTLIYIFFQKEDLIYRGVNVNLAAGLEDNLITIFKPPWNNLGSR